MELVVLLAVTFGVIGLAGRLPEERQVKRDLARRRLDTLSALVDGKVVTLRGTVRATDGVLTAPLTQRRCVYWRLLSERTRSEQSVPFELETSDGRVRVVVTSPRLGVHGETANESIEHVIAVDALVTLRGVCTYEPDPERTDVDQDAVYRGGARPLRPVISGSRKVRLLVG